MKGNEAGFLSIPDIHSSWEVCLYVALVAALLACGVGTRLYRLEEESLWLDEQITWSNLELPALANYLDKLRSRDATFVPSYYVLLYYWGKATAYSVTAARALSVSFGLGTMLLVFLLAFKAYGPAAGIVALGLTALSNTQVYYDQEIRVYALYSLAAVLSAWSLEKALHSAKPVHWRLHIGANLVLVLSHYFGTFIVMAEGVYLLLFHHRPLKRIGLWFAAQSCLALLLIFWMLGIRLDVLESTTAFLTVPGLADLEYALSWAALYWPRFLYPYAYLTRISVVLVALFVVYCFWKREKTPRANEQWRQTVLFVLLCFFPLLLSLALTYGLRPAFALRYVLPSALPFFILLGGALGSLPFRAVRWGCVALLLGLLAAHHFEAARPFRPDIRKAGMLLEENYSEKDALLILGFIDLESQRMYLNYPQERIHHCHAAEEAPSQVLDLLEAHPNVWILCIFDHGRDYNSYAAMESHLRDAGIVFERTVVSSEHYTFMKNSNWPTLGDVARRVHLYRAEGNFPVPGNQSRRMRPRAISILSS